MFREVSELISKIDHSTYDADSDTAPAKNSIGRSDNADKKQQREYINERVYKRNSAKIYILALLHPHDFFANSSHNV